MTEDEGLDEQDRPVSGEQLEHDWERALDAAGGAVSAADRAGTLRQDELDAERHQVNEERTWLGGIGSTMRKLFPRRGAGGDE